MPESTLRRIRAALWILLAAVVVRLGLALFRPSPLSDLRIPALPSLTSTNAPTHSPPVPTPTPTPSPASAPSTNRPPATHSVTNSVTAKVTNSPPNGTNVAKIEPPRPSPSGPAMMPGMPPGMPGMPPGFPMPGGGPRGGSRGGAPLSPQIQARLDRIIQSELLGPVPRPLPMALLGIAGTNAFLRSSSGMSGMVAEGGELGGLRLVRIGTNRVLVNEGGTNKELTIFGGAGGESLLPRSTNQP